MSSKKEGIKFLGIDIENFKNITHRTIDIGGQSIKIVGPNGSGKSSLIQALCSPLDAKIVPTEAIKKGEEKAKIKVRLGGIMSGSEVEYTIEMFFSQGNKKGRVVVYNEKGEKMNAPATFIKSLIGNVSFDITSWLHLPSDKKLKMLKELTGCEEKVNEVMEKIKETKKKMSDNKARANDLEAILRNHNFDESEIEKYSKPIDIEPIQAEIAGISKSMSNYQLAKNRVSELKKDRETLVKEVTEASEKIKEYERLIHEAQNMIERHDDAISELNGRIETGEKWLAERSEQNVEEVNARLTDAVAHNERYNQVKDLAEKQREMLGLRESLGNLDIHVQKLETRVHGIIRESQLPIDGLEFTEDGISIDGLPLEEGQINTARLFDIGVDVAIALNPNLKVIFLHDASLFDKHSLETVLKKATERDFQVIAEVVGESDLHIEFTEHE